MPVSLERLARSLGHPVGKTELACLPRGETCFIGQITTEALAVYVSGVARMAGVGVFALLGALPDYGEWRHWLLFLFTVLGGGAALAWPLATGWSHWACLIMAASLFIIIRVAQFITVVIKNSYLPLLCHLHPKYSEDERGVDLLYSSLSARSSIMGFLGGFCVLLCMNLAILFTPGQPGWVWRAAVGFCGIWWLLGSLFSWWHLPRLAGPPLPADESVLLFSVRRMVLAWGKIQLLPMAFAYLGCSAFLTAAYQAMQACLVLLGLVRLAIDQRLVILVGLSNPLLSALGNYLCLQLQRCTGLSTRHTLCLILGMMAMAPLWCTLGLLSGRIGMRHAWEFFLVQACISLGLGALTSADRVMLAELIPVAEANEFYGLSGMTGRLAGALASLLYGTIESAGEFRWAQLMIALFFLAPIPPLLLYVDQHEGKLQVEAYERRAKANLIEIETEMTEKN